MHPCFHESMSPAVQTAGTIAAHLNSEYDKLRNLAGVIAGLLYAQIPATWVKFAVRVSEAFSTTGECAEAAAVFAKPASVDAFLKVRSKVALRLYDECAGDDSVIDFCGITSAKLRALAADGPLLTELAILDSKTTSKEECATIWTAVFSWVAGVAVVDVAPFKAFADDLARTTWPPATTAPASAPETGILAV